MIGARRRSGPFRGGDAFHLIGGETRYNVSGPGEKLRYGFQRAPGGQDNAAIGVAQNGLDSGMVAARARNIGGHRDDARVQTTKQRFNKLQTRSVQEQRPLSPETKRSQFHRERSRPAIEFTIGQRWAFTFAIDQPGIDPVGRTFLRQLLKNAYQRGTGDGIFVRTMWHQSFTWGCCNEAPETTQRSTLVTGSAMATTTLR